MTILEPVCLTSAHSQLSSASNALTAVGTKRSLKIKVFHSSASKGCLSPLRVPNHEHEWGQNGRF